MNDINKPSDQNIVLPTQLHYIIYLTNELTSELSKTTAIKTSHVIT